MNFEQMSLEKVFRKIQGTENESDGVQEDERKYIFIPMRIFYVTTFRVDRVY